MQFTQKENWKKRFSEFLVSKDFFPIRTEYKLIVNITPKILFIIPKAIENEFKR